jgi:hypothetical protein
MPAPAPAIDDFEPKPTKEKKVKEVKAAKEKPEPAANDDFEAKTKAALPFPHVIAATVSGIVTLILALFILGGGGGKVDAAVEAAKAESARELQAFKDEANGKIGKLEEEAKALAAKVDSLEGALNAVSARQQTAARPAQRPPQRRR